MNKKEFYNNVLDLYKKTGQGLSQLVLMDNHEVHDIVDELISEGLLKKVVTKYNHLPDDTWICLTKGYCVEEDSIHNLSFMRFYIGLDKIMDLGPSANVTLKDAIKNIDFISEYKKWLKKNLEKLEEIKTISSYIIKDVELSIIEEEYLKERGFFKDNLSIRESIIEFEEGTEKIQKEIYLINEICPLLKRVGRLDEDTKYTKDLEDLEEELIMRKKIYSFLKNQLSEIKIQSLFK